MKPPKLHAMFLLTLLACLLTGAAPCAASDVFATVSPGLDAPAGPAAAEPQIILNAPSDYWSIGGGLLYWSLNPSADYDDEWWALKRRPLAGDLVRVLATTASSGMPWTHLWADETGVFYINQDTDLVEFRSIGVPTTVVGVATPSDANSLVLASDESYFYIAGPANVRRGSRDSYGTGTLSELDGVNSLFVKDTYLWMMNSTGIYRQDKSCTTIACQTGYELRVSAAERQTPAPGRRPNLLSGRARAMIGVSAVSFRTSWAARSSTRPTVRPTSAPWWATRRTSSGSRCPRPRARSCAACRSPI